MFFAGFACKINYHVFQKCLKHIHINPVRAGYVANYLYSSASNYINGKGLIEVDFIF